MMGGEIVIGLIIFLAALGVLWWKLGKDKETPAFLVTEYHPELEEIPAPIPDISEPVISLVNTIKKYPSRFKVSSEYRKRKKEMMKLAKDKGADSMEVREIHTFLHIWWTDDDRTLLDIRSGTEFKAMNFPSFEPSYTKKTNYVIVAPNCFTKDEEKLIVSTVLESEKKKDARKEAISKIRSNRIKSEQRQVLMEVYCND